MFERSSFKSFFDLKLNGYHYSLVGEPKAKTKTKNRQQDGLIAKPIR
jgi:hypothetical protein